MKLALSLLVLAAVAVAARAAVPTPPASRAEEVVDELHGERVADPYRWLEGDNSDPAQMGRMTAEVAAWTDAQNAHTRAVLDSLPGRAELEARLKPLLEVATVGKPEMRGDRYFYTRREGDQNQPVWYWRTGARGEERVLLDPAKVDPSGLTAIEWLEPSDDGRLVAWGSYRAGDENTELRLLEVDSGRALPDVIPNKVRAVDWLPDGSGFFYRNLSDSENPYSGQVKFHRLGAAVADDRLVLRQLRPEEDARLATTYGPYQYLSEDGRWLGLVYYTGTRTNDLWVMPVAEFLAGAEPRRIPVAVGLEAEFGGPIVGDTMYMSTTLEAPNGRIVAVDLADPARERWRTLIPERADTVIEATAVGRDALVLQVLRDAANALEVWSFDGRRLGEVKLPGIGSTAISSRVDRTEAYVAFTSFNYPTTIFRVDLANPAAPPELWERPPVPVDPDSAEVKLEWFSSKDGTKVSMFVVHRKGLPLDGSNPTLLYGYGGFTVSMTPYFSATLFQWLDAGGVFAVPHLRGGGEYGEAWHRGGMLESKEKTFEDFEAAAEHLIARGYTRPEKLVIEGGSNGGLLTGAAITRRPELYRAAIVAVPLLDMLRYERFLMARYWVPEYGAATDPAQYRWLAGYSPYHRVRTGVRYPAVFLSAGENDARVHPMHARKMTARLQAVAAGVEAARPVLLWIDREAGHGQGKPLNLKLREIVDERIFLMWQLGMLPAAPAPPAR
jgi:prolyl oligopeptidase